MAQQEAHSHGATVLAEWDQLEGLLRQTNTAIEINGASLNLAAVVAAARYQVTIKLSPGIKGRVQASSALLAERLARGDCIYGVNTGFGGSADTRTHDIYGLQRTLIEMLQYGILDAPTSTSPHRQAPEHDGDASPFSQILPIDNSTAATCMPETWVRASLVVRSNSLASGNSGVKLELIECLAQLVDKDIIPLIPLRGSISASGDLSPLSYIAGVIQGSPGVRVWTGDRRKHQRRALTAKEALPKASIQSVKLGPKEGLAICNGTSVSAGIAALALHDAHHLAVLSQILTAMGVEALTGSIESFHHFFSAVRPHAGRWNAQLTFAPSSPAPSSQAQTTTLLKGICVKTGILYARRHNGLGHSLRILCLRTSRFLLSSIQQPTIR